MAEDPSTPQADPSSAPADPSALLRSNAFVVLLVIAGVVGVLVSLAAWCFLELVYQIQQELFHHLPHALGYNSGPPLWWSLPVLGIAGLVVAFAIVRLPGEGGHIPAEGLKVSGGPTQPIELPGIMLAALAAIGLGTVIGPEAPLIALGSGLAVLTVKLVRREAPPQLLVVVAAAGSFAALSFIFTSPIIAAVLMIEATGLSASRLPVVLLPGLVGAGIGTLVSIGMGSFTGLSTSAYSLGALPLPDFHRPTIANFGWTIALALLVAVVAHLIRTGGLKTHQFVTPRPFLLLPLAGLIVAGLAIAFSQASDKGVNEVLFSGQDALPGLISGAGKWSLGALTLLIIFKGIGYAISLGSFRGGPTFPAMFLGAAGGLMASHLPGFPITAAVAVGIGTGTVAMLRLPLSAIVIASLLTGKAGSGAEPLTIIGVAVCYVVTLRLSALRSAKSASVPADAQVGSAAPAQAAAK